MMNLFQHQICMLILFDCSPFTGFCAVFEYVNEEDTLDHEGIVIVNNLFG